MKNSIFKFANSFKVIAAVSPVILCVIVVVEALVHAHSPSHDVGALQDIL